LSRSDKATPLHRTQLIVSATETGKSPLPALRSDRDFARVPDHEVHVSIRIQITRRDRRRFAEMPRRHRAAEVPLPALNNT
jgi:hypothetical protein